MKVKSESEVTQSCLTLSDPMDCSLPGFSAHGIFQVRVLEWVAIAFSTSGPTTSWQIEGEKMEVVTNFLFLGSKITVDGDCSHKIRRCLLLKRKAMIILDSVLKSRDITLPTKVHIVKIMVFLVVTYCCESCTIKKAECRRTDAFKLWCWRRFLRVPCTARRSKQSILRVINPE